MKVCMVSDYMGIKDEGVRNTAFYLARELTQDHELLHVCLMPRWSLLKPGFWKRVGAFKPDLIHFVPGPTFKSFLLVKAFKRCYPPARTVMSAAHPAVSPLFRRFIPWVKPDLVLTQSPESQAMFSRLGCATRFLPGGVDTAKFVPVSRETQLQLRRKYGIAEDKWVVMHAGPVQVGRNLRVFNRLQAEAGIQVLIIGSLSVPADRKIYHSLVKGGCLVWHRYLENMAEIYALADCYVFPTLNRDNSIEMPLSVMEAMACNLPVLSTRFRALPHVLTPGDGLSFIAGESELVAEVLRQKRDGVSARTREKVSGFTWKAAAARLELIYDEVYNGIKK